MDLSGGAGSIGTPPLPTFKKHLPYSRIIALPTHSRKYATLVMMGSKSIFVLWVVLLSSCKMAEPPPINGRWVDRFDRKTIGKNYFPTSDRYQIVNETLYVQGALNHPLWLRKRLPDNVTIEFDTKVNK